MSAPDPRPEATGIADRDRYLAMVAGGASFDVLIVGAGINGAGTFRDLALQGVRCLIVDREDFGAGASSASTRMAHGGLRYLENGEVRLVAEATLERNRLLRNAPHAVSPMLVTIPSFTLFGGALATIGKLLRRGRGGGPIRSRGLFLARLGLIAYDWLGRRRRAMPRHSLARGARARRLLPDLHPGTRGFVSYYDAKISHSERVAFELVADGLAAQPGGAALNHCVCERREAGEVVLRDRIGGHELRVRPKLVINACGAWIDDVNARVAPSARLIGGTKGSHIVLDNPRLRDAMAGRAFSFDDGTGRMCVSCPLGDMILLGSSDIRIDDPDAAVCDDAEVAYFLGAIRLIFPMIDVRPQDIRYRFSGVRPLPRSRAANTVDISRDHSIVRRDADAEAPFPVLSLVGGKWTTFRAFAEQVTDRVLAEVGLPRRHGTQDLPIGGGAGFPLQEPDRQRWIAECAARSGVPAPRVAVLLSRYGTRARPVAEFCGAAPDAPLADAPEYSEREIAYLVHREMAVTLDDIVYRRTTLAMWGRLSFPLLGRLAAIVARERGGAQRERDLLAGIVERLARQNGIDYRDELSRAYAEAVA